MAKTVTVEQGKNILHVLEIGPGDQRKLSDGTFSLVEGIRKTTAMLPGRDKTSTFLTGNEESILLQRDIINRR